MRSEGFKPVAVASPSGHLLAFALRCMFDLQLATIVRRLRPALRTLRGAVLDVGAGQSPWREWLTAGTSYVGLDVGHAADFGMSVGRPDVLYYDGRVMPLEDASFQAALCIEVLEHAQAPELTLAEVARVLQPGGVLLLSVPWSARRHHVPHDYHRFTRERLQEMLAAAGFEQIRIYERGNDIGSIANKLVVLALRLARPRPPWHAAWSWPLLLLLAPVTGSFVVAFHVSSALGLGSPDDPLGYFVQAAKRPGRSESP